ncbi:MAG: XRE family transcriptional regulator [Bdellovibrio sp.]|nr:MAG: XRE family transcriptional regulator [Bdellovibrio sp.]
MGQIRFKDNLKHLMLVRGLKLSDVSKATGIPKSTLSEWTAGREPKISEALLKLAQYLGVSLEELLTGGERSLVFQEKLSIPLTIESHKYLLKLVKVVSGGSKNV